MRVRLALRSTLGRGLRGNASHMKFVDLFAGIGGFHQALAGLGHECVFASELDEELRAAYVKNFTDMPRGAVVGDIRESIGRVPDHDILCAGFPCQPFSKSGEQRGMLDKTRGTLFHELLKIIKTKAPRFVILENVGNFSRHDGGNTWKIVRESLENLDYYVQGTEHVTPVRVTDWRDRGGPNGTKQATTNGHKPARGTGLISPHHFGYPQHRERFFIVASKAPLPDPAFPVGNRKCVTDLSKVVLTKREIGAEWSAVQLSAQQRSCIDHWNELLQALPADIEPPSFPLWGDELNASYPFEERTPWGSSMKVLWDCVPGEFHADANREELLSGLPSYAREQVNQFRGWKIEFIRNNRAWWKSAKRHLPAGWAQGLGEFPPSLRKLEWNVKGGERDIWRYVLQFRPSGLRVRRYTSCPALVAMTTTQIPVLGPERRFITKTEGLLLQGFPPRHVLPASRDNAFRALGNAVHVGVARRIAAHLLGAVGSEREPCRRSSIA